MSEAAGDSLESARGLLAAVLELEPGEIPDNAAIGQLGRWDSLAHMRLIMALETQMGEQLPPETMVAIASLADITAVLQGEPLSARSW